MADALTTITNLINSPPGQLVAGGVLAGIVWKFFERVENVLRDQTKKEIADWLLGVKVGQKVEPWPETFAKVFDKVLGAKALSWRCFNRSYLLSFAVVILILTFAVISGQTRLNVVAGSGLGVLATIVGLNLVPNYIGLLATRAFVSQLRNPSSLTFEVRGYLFSKVSIRDFTLSLLAFDCVFRLVAADWLVKLWKVAMFGNLEALKSVNRTHPSVVSGLLPVFENYITLSIQTHLALVRYPLLLMSIWLWLYAGSGFLLKAAKRFDIPRGTPKTGQ